ncbi:MAG: hypothetical protein ACXWQE_00095 [Bdellovibrionales bacterium]
MSEDLTCFLADDLIATDVAKGSSSFRGIYNAPGELIADGMVMSEEHSVLMKSSDCAGWKDKDQITVDIGSVTDFYVRMVFPEGDGKFSRVTLSKA